MHKKICEISKFVHLKVVKRKIQSRCRNENELRTFFQKNFKVNLAFEKYILKSKVI